MIAQVYVVRPADPAEDVLVFARDIDAANYCEARWGALALPDEIEAATVIDAETAAEMISEEKDAER